ncbi:MAG: alpha/beta fold hydrolase [Burkholderiales bacterium]
MREDTTFTVSGLALSGWIYTPDQGQGPYPVIVMSHGFGAIKEMSLDQTAEIFCQAGYVVVVYDHRNTGLSAGEPRGELDPWQQINDMRDVITLASLLPQVDPQRIGLWGTSYSGGHVLVVAAVDRRVKCVVSQAPTVSGYKNTLRSIPADKFDAFLEEIAQDRINRAKGLAPKVVPISTEGSESYAWSIVAGKGTAYVNAVTLRTRDFRMGYEPGIYIPRIAPTPLLMILASHDTRCPTDDQLAAYSTAHEPRKLHLFKGGHYDPYSIRLKETAGASRDWFDTHLGRLD